LILEKCGLGCGGFESEDFIRTRKGDTSLLGALDIAFENEIWFVNLLESAWLLSYGGGKGVESRRSSLPFAREGLEETFIHFVQTVLIDLKHLECGNRGSSGSGALGTGERVITNPAEEVVCDAWGASAAPSNFGGGLWF
jgi:hypothetical protein